MSASTNRSKFSAAASMQGYIFQCRFALLETLKRLKADTRISVAIETLDDVVFEKDGNPTEIIQIKHHKNREASLTDSSIDLWKTLRIWMDLSTNECSDKSATFFMVTTAKATDDSAAHFLKLKYRGVETAMRKLVQVAQTSTNIDTRDIRRAFLELPDDVRKGLLENVYIVDSIPQCDDIDLRLQEELWAACERNKAQTFLSYLEGWWYRRVLKSFSDDSKRIIIGEEIEYQLNDLRESFKNDALPIHFDLKAATVDRKLYSDRVFVQQLDLIEIGTKRISIAINNYYRAFEQRSRWVREDLLYIGDIEDYERQLKEEWDLRFETMREKIGQEAAEQEKIKVAQEIYEWAEKDANIPIKKNCTEIFITRGSYHILADQMVIGWHPEFQSRLANLFGVKKEVFG